jgi:hypothetical protein
MNIILQVLTHDAHRPPQECEYALVHCIVQRLTRTFLTLSLAEIARHAGVMLAVSRHFVRMTWLSRVIAVSLRIMTCLVFRYVCNVVINGERHVSGLDSAAEAQAVILNMVESGKINAKISQTDEMVSFQDSSEHFDTAAALEVGCSKLHTTTACRSFQCLCMQMKARVHCSELHCLLSCV